VSDATAQDASVPPRLIDAGPAEEFFWTSGADGILRFLGCAVCGRLHHPPAPRCPYCQSTEVAPTPVSGQGTIATYTINHQPFLPGFEPPYAIAIVEIDEDPTIRLTTNLVGIADDAVHIGMRVEVCFERNGEWYVPLFRRLG
jgi:uncharacterized OB-fold protein